MTDLDMTNKLAFECFKRARDYYVFRLFDLAQQEIKKYKQGVDYQKFDQSDRRTKNVPQISVVVVSHQAGQLLLSCLQSVFKQEGPSFEVILVDNGGNEEVYDELAKIPLLTIKPPVNVLPSEGRNIGGHFSRGQLIIFLDDDALMVRGYLDSAFSVMADESLIGLRGKVISKTPNKIAPKHYSLGDTPTEAEFNLEGNMVIRKTVFDAAGGFDALMFGHEGKELTQRCKRQFSDRLVQYRPELCIEHDFAEMASLDAKRERQSLGQEYLIFLENKNTIKGRSIEGLSILVRAGDDLAGAKEFLESLVKHNSYRPIEVLLVVNDIHNALKLSRDYLTQILIRIVSAGDNYLNLIVDKTSFENILIVNLPTKLKDNILSYWIQNQKTNIKSALICKKININNIENLSFDIQLSKLAEKLGMSKIFWNTSSVPALMNEVPKSSKLETTPGVKVRLFPEQRKSSKKFKVLVVSPRKLGILGTPGTYLFVEALAKWVDLVILCNSDGKPNEKAPQVHIPSANLRIIEASFSKGIDLEIHNIIQSFSPNIAHIMIWQKWYEITKIIRKYSPGVKIVLDIKTPLLAEGDIREHVQSNGDANEELIDLIMTPQRDEEKTWIPNNKKPVSEYPLAISVNQIDGADILNNKWPLKCVYIGSIHPKRQIERLLWLISNIQPDLRNILILDIYGAGGSSKELLELVKQYQLDDQVRVLDPIPQDVLFPKLREYDIGIAWVPWGEYDMSPSLKFLEYAASRLTIIATDTLAHKKNVSEGFESYLFDNTSSGLENALAAAKEQIKIERNQDKNYLLACTRDWNIISQHYFVYAYSRLMIDDSTNQSIRKSLSTMYSQITELSEFVIRHPFVLQKLKLIKKNRDAYKFF